VGNWRITIEGHGTHHNGKDDDANAIAARAVKELKAAGHAVTKQEFAVASRLGPGEVIEETHEPEEIEALTDRLAAEANSTA
jgi:hypothetical protein